MFGDTKVVRTVVSLVCFVALSQQQTEDEKVRAYLEGDDGYNARAEALSNRYSIASWAYYTNITSFNSEKMVKVFLLYRRMKDIYQLSRLC